ncbi:MAG TPA: toxin-antitoxin system HicB family antitoxin [Candidatus Dormibacteraeota bacterium]|nr:toxin-antitoxin system HicB family antitoxin [Candidatus Dormibacteraeota bacterium]
MAARKPFLLRIDPQLYDALERWAQDELRSVNGHIEYLLNQALRQAGRQPKQRSNRRE